MGVHNIATTEDKSQAVATETGAIVGGELGAEVGAVIGFFFGGSGAVLGAIIGGVAGSIVGVVGADVRKEAHDALVKPNQQKE